MNSRSLKTKSKIKEGTLKLMENHSLDAITVTNICKEVDIGRRTFYDHFIDKFEVVELIIDGYIEEFKKAVSHYNQNSFKENITRGFNFITEDNLFLILYKSTLSRYFLKKIESFFKEMIQKYLNHAYLQQQNISETTILTFLSNAVLGIIIETVSDRNNQYLSKVDEITKIVRPYFRVSPSEFRD